MTTTIFDAVTVDALPGDATVLLGYIDGADTAGNYAAVRERYPAARILTVTTTGRNAADICDVESGDATPAVAAAGVRAGLYRTIYSATGTKGTLDRALAGLAWNWYAADPTGKPHLVAGSVATQWAWPNHGSPGNYDVSDALSTWLTPTPSPPVPVPPPSPVIGGKTMTCDRPGGGIYTCRADGSVDAFEGAPFFGSMAGIPLSAPIVGICATPSGEGYWLVGADGMIYAFGDAPYLGPLPKYVEAWGVGVNTPNSIIGLVRGNAAGVSYTIVATGGGAAAALYGITTDGQYTR